MGMAPRSAADPLQLPLHLHTDSSMQQRHPLALPAGALPLPEGAWAHMAYRVDSLRWRPDFQLLQETRPFCPEPPVCLSLLSFSLPAPAEAQFPIVSLFPPIVG